MHNRTDLAIEAALSMERIPGGIEVEERDINDSVRMERVIVTNEEGEKAIGKPQGTYITLHAHEMAEGEHGVQENCAKAFAHELGQLLPERRHGDRDPVLVVGLGNRAITPDSLGPRTVDKLLVTRHLYALLPDQVDERAGCVAAIAPGVLGETGMESGEVIVALVQKIRPCAVIAIDALAALSTTRLTRTIQLADTGIAPGAGIGNRRPRLDKALLGVPVLAVGVPMVVHAMSLVSDVLEQSGHRSFDQARVQQACGNLIVTPKDIDEIAARCAQVLAIGLNMALHGELAYAEAVDLVL